MIILAISDIHERVKKLAKLVLEVSSLNLKIDVVIVAGDLTYFKSVNTAKRVLLEVKNALEVNHVFFVPGNCDDPALLSVKEIESGIINLHRNLVKFKNYVFYGIGGGGISPFNTLIEFSEEEFREHIYYFKNINYGEAANTILITHQPIYGFYDKVNSLNIGSRSFREFLGEEKPLLWITGHVHENSGYTISGRTVIVHPGPFMHGYYAIIELSDTEPSVLRVSIFKIQN
jgi:Icc-related predicted phosphoesterase